jgi:hypothetical protein
MKEGIIGILNPIQKSKMKEGIIGILNLSYKK